MESDEGGFTAVLDRRSAPPASDAAPKAQNPDAAGPSGELPSEDVADADASPVTTVLAADVAAVIAAAVVVAAPAAVEAIPVAATPSGTAAAAGTVTATATTGTMPATPAPLPSGVVPAIVDGDGSVAPAPAPAAVAAPVADAAGDAAPATGTTPAAATPTGPAPAAQLTLTLSRIDPALADGATATPVATPVADGDAPAAPVAAPRPVAQDVATAAPKAAEATAGTTPTPLAVNGPPTPPHANPLDGLTRAGGMTTAHELARELGHRVQMAVREGGRELLINLRPPDLGHLTIRVTMTEGVMQAQIIADRPEAARLLQQSLAHLDSSLGDLGYSLDSLDVAYSGQDPRDAQSSSRGTGAGRDDSTGSDGDVAAAPSTTAAVAGDPGRLDLLA
ncbi:flagellar hook-length control protein FliK [Miltoncostaea oceani]|uniref:flagellar hook-length control protein FliK n=1 Tax=Miltoncostaea oceani TaxID=2843216 RepID=UPI001C3C9100|nr:flagellar hook-length control protein FliK [Miltoncostaea oceani]